MREVYGLAGVSKQAHHQYFGREEAFIAELELLIPQVDLIRRSHPGCGLEKLYFTLNPQCMGRDKFIEVFKELGYGVRRERNHCRTTIPGPLRFPNLITGMLVMAPNRVWQTDITYYQVGERFFYLVFIIDVYTKLILGYQASDHLRAEANQAALRMALRIAKPPAGTIHHSDFGTQYTSREYIRMLHACGMLISMAECAQDNAYAERINGIIKNEYLKHFHITGLAKLKVLLAKAVRQYNERRIHNALPGRTTPSKFAQGIVNLSIEERPKMIVYSQGNHDLRKASSLSDFKPETGLQDLVCPLKIKPKKVNAI